MHRRALFIRHGGLQRTPRFVRVIKPTCQNNYLVIDRDRQQTSFFFTISFEQSYQESWLQNRGALVPIRLCLKKGHHTTLSLGTSASAVRSPDSARDEKRCQGQVRRQVYELPESNLANNPGQCRKQSFYKWIHAVGGWNVKPSWERAEFKKSCQGRLRHFDTGAMNATTIYYHRKHPPH